jgi:50S ribosomal protein L16 3-hydroxylase
MQRNRAQPKLHHPSPEQLLGGISPGEFLKVYWHKKPLLVRQAVPGLERILDGSGLLDLASREDAESRLVRSSRGRWQLEHGPFDTDTLARLPRRNWSVLVQGVNMLLDEGDRLLDCFKFIPYARLDDLMVSFAPPGGGVGPHFDSYDVFLIQGLGRRRWEISAQCDLDLVEGAPLRILKHFEAEQAWELEPGDMLYLPPKYAHNGIALTDCMTWSIGFRAPTTQEIATEFLAYLQDTMELEGRYADPDLRPSRHPGKIPAAMQRQLKAMIRKIRWDNEGMEDFIGRYLSEPKPNVFFDPPQRAMAFEQFARQAVKKGLRLDPRTRLLYDRRAVFINGEPVPISDAYLDALVSFADQRSYMASSPTDPALAPCYEWYLDGFLHVQEA